MEFYNTLGDIASTAEFIRACRIRFDLLNAPFFLAGESYGTWRAAGAAELLEKTGVRPSGVMLISGGLAMAQAAPAWAKRDTLSDADRERIISGLAKYTGVSPSAIDRATLAMTSPQFTSTLLSHRSVTLGRYDMRIVSGAGASPPTAGAGEAAARNQILIRYLRETLGFKTDLTYQGLETGWSPAGGGRGAGPAARWVWNQGGSELTSGTDATTRANRAAVGSGDGPPGGRQPWMRRAMALDPQLKLFVAAGKYDSLNSCADNSWTVSQLAPAVMKNITLGCYAGGHIMYDTKAARVRLRDDAAAFVKGANR